MGTREFFYQARGGFGCKQLMDTGIFSQVRIYRILKECF